MQLDVVDETLLRLKTLQSEQEDLDYAVAVAELSKQSVALEAAMSSFAKIAALNLFDYLGR
jgi:flagellar hook-associated protein 3 FlgL